MSDVFYYPVIDTFVWGLTISAFKNQNSPILLISSILVGLILWYGIWRGQYEITVNLLEELWSENITNLLSSPLKISEWVLGFLSLGIMKLIFNMAIAALLSWLLYKVNIFILGFYLIPFIISLLYTGWVFGLLIGGLFLRYGTDIQTLAWAGGALLMPFSSVFYPVSVLPTWMQKISAFIPSAYIFEGMRQVIFTQRLDIILIYKSYLLNSIYLIFALWFFIASFNHAKDAGIAHLK
jgi:ABC-2 type transport system permease protein